MWRDDYGQKVETPVRLHGRRTVRPLPYLSAVADSPGFCTILQGDVPVEMGK
jgi:hypothetical protein